jgi:predicted CoA-binding protein
MKKTMIIGASIKPDRYAFKAAHKLNENGHSIVLLGKSNGQVLGQPIITDQMYLPTDIDTITLYVSPQHQAEWQDYILSVNPQRVIFNPGTENPVLEAVLMAHQIEVLEACTLVMLSVGTY